MSQLDKWPFLGQRNKSRVRTRTHRVRAASALMFVACLVITGCGTDEPKDAPKAGKSAKLEGKLVVWDGYFGAANAGSDAATSPFKRMFGDISKQFMKLHPGVTIEHQSFPFAGYDVRVRGAIASRRGPDVVFAFQGLDPKTLKQGFVPLDERISEDQKKNLRGFSKYELDGKQMSMPWALGVDYIVFNRELFTKAGLDPDAPPETWADFLTSCGKLRAAGIDPMALGFKDGAWAVYTVGQLGPRLVTKEQLAKNNSLELSWTETPEVRKAHEYFLEAHEAGCFSKNSETKVGADVIPDFTAGKAAMRFESGTYAIPDYRKTLGDENIGVMQWPRMPDQPHDEQIAVIEFGASPGITSWSKQQDLAWEWMSYFLGVEAETLAWNTARVAPNNAAVKIEELENLDPLEAEVLGWSLNPKNQVGYLWPPGRGRAYDVAAQYITGLMTGRVTLDDYLKRVDKARLENAKTAN